MEGLRAARNQRAKQLNLFGYIFFSVYFIKKKFPWISALGSLVWKTTPKELSSTTTECSMTAIESTKITNWSTKTLDITTFYSSGGYLMLTGHRTTNLKNTIWKKIKQPEINSIRGQWPTEKRQQKPTENPPSVPLRTLISSCLSLA